MTKWKYCCEENPSIQKAYLTREFGFNSSIKVWRWEFAYPDDGGYHWRNEDGDAINLPPTIFKKMQWCEIPE